jgi:regulator of protease activity HflC (stomatin/prohibitin superfamily)
MSWVEALIQYFREIVTFFSPIRIVRPYRRLVVFRWGHYHRTMGEGFNWCWPCKIEETESVLVSEETRNQISQSVTTTDGVAVTFSANICFKIVDPELYWCAVFDFEASVEAVSMTHLHKRARKMTWVELYSGLDELEASLKSTLTTRVKKWGAEIQSVGFTDLVAARSYRLFGDPQSKPDFEKAQSREHW